jgi:hypothetical protein
MSDPVSANPMPTVVPPSPDEGIITLNYDGSGLGWVDLWDNAIIAWVIDANDVSVGPSPRILGTFPPAPPDTSPVLTPSWAAITRAGNVFVADTWRGTFYDFLTWLATNNGAQRKVIGNGLRDQPPEPGAGQLSRRAGNRGRSPAASPARALIRGGMLAAVIVGAARDAVPVA